MGGVLCPEPPPQGGDGDQLHVLSDATPWGILWLELVTMGTLFSP